MNKQIISIVSRKQIHKYRSLSLTPEVRTDLYTDQREENKNTNIRISQISQYIEAKSEKILKIYKNFTDIYHNIQKT